MKKISNTFYDRIEKNNKNQYYKIGFYDNKNNSFNEVARFRNSYNSTSGANYGLLQIWAITFSVGYYEIQGGWNTCGGYNKPIANLESCLFQLKEDLTNNKIVCDCGSFEVSSCGSITSLLEGLKDFLQKQYTKPLFLMDCNG